VSILPCVWARHIVFVMDGAPSASGSGPDRPQYWGSKQYALSSSKNAERFICFTSGSRLHECLSNDGPCTPPMIGVSVKLYFASVFFSVILGSVLLCFYKYCYVRSDYFQVIKNKHKESDY
jgi:hypothetical protein